MEQRIPLDADFDEFVAAHSARLFRTAYLLVGDHQRAEDLVQAALVTVYLRWRRVAAMEEPGAYARRVLVNEALSWKRRRSSREVALPLEDVAGPPMEDRLVESQVVWRAVLDLPARQRAVVVLRYYEDLTEADTAAALGVAVGTVKSAAHAACRRLAAVLGPEPATGSRRQR